MDNLSLLLNTSDTNLSLPVEFPYWQLYLAVTVVPYTFSVGCIIAVHLVLLVALLKTKKEQFKPLNIIHLSLLISALVEDVLRIILNIVYSPSITRYCVCSAIVGTIFVSESLFFAIYRPLAFACLAVLQLLLIIGKKKFVNVKTSCGMIALCIGVSLISVASTARIFFNTNERVYCYESYCPNSRPESGLGVFVTVLACTTLAVFLPSLVVVFVTSTWSCAVFKHHYTGGDDQLNRRILSLPIVMPLVLIASSILEAMILLLIAEVILILSLGVYSPYWIGLSQTVALIFSRFLIRTTYPVVLAYTHSHVRKSLKEMLRRFRGTNRVTPVSSDTSTTRSD